MVRDSLAIVRLMAKRASRDPESPARRAEQRDSGNSQWSLQDGLHKEDVEAGTGRDLPEDFDEVLPMGSEGLSEGEPVIVMRFVSGS